MSMTERLQEYVKNNMTLDDILPTKLPVYLNSMVYLFGVLLLSTLVMLILTGIILAIFGPYWHHVNATGRSFTLFTSGRLSCSSFS